MQHVISSDKFGDFVKKSPEFIVLQFFVFFFFKNSLKLFSNFFHFSKKKNCENTQVVYSENKCGDIQKEEKEKKK